MESNKIVTVIAESPAKALESAIDTSQHAISAIFSKDSIKDARNYWHALGPGLTSGASDDDPSGIGTYSQAGAIYGFGMLWLAWFSYPFMSVVQETCARIGMATGRGLAGNIRKHFSVKILYFLTLSLFVANTFNLGADLGAIAAAIKLIYPQVSFFAAIVSVTVISLGLIIFTSYSKYAKYLKYLALVLLLYVATALTLPNLNWPEIFHQTLWPNFQLSGNYILMICAILGTTISPYLFFWQTSQEVEQRNAEFSKPIMARHTVLSKSEVKKMRFDVWSGMFLSNLVMFFIIVTCGATLHVSGIEINTAQDAAEALRPLAGSQATILFALGIIGTGLLAIPVLAGASAYALAETFSWKSGLNKSLKHAYGFYGVIIIAFMLGLVLNFIGLDPIKALVYSAILNGIIAPIMLFFILKIASDKLIMGRWRNGLVSSILGWIIFGVMSAVALASILIIIF